MSAAIWLVDENDEQIDLLPDELEPRRGTEAARGHASRRLNQDSANLTYNLSPMLWDAGFPGWRDVVDRPASEIGSIFAATVTALRSHPERSRGFNPENGWGTYEQAVDVLSILAAACERNLGATVRGWL